MQCSAMLTFVTVVKCQLLKFADSYAKRNLQNNILMHLYETCNVILRHDCHFNYTLAKAQGCSRLHACIQLLARGSSSSVKAARQI